MRLIGVEAGGHGIETGQHAASLTGGRPGVLHGNRTYLLQDDDGQIIEAHSISAGLDYPGIGPEHSWLHDIGRVEYVSATDQEALAAFQLCTRTEGIIPALEPAHALAHVTKLAPTMAAGPDHPDESLRPRRQGHLRGRRTPRGEAVSRIAARFADLKRQGRGALIPFLEAWDPDQRDLDGAAARHARGRRRPDRDRHAVHRPDGRRPDHPGRRQARPRRRA